MWDHSLETERKQPQSAIVTSIAIAESSCCSSESNHCHSGAHPWIPHHIFPQIMTLSISRYKMQQLKTKGPNWLPDPSWENWKAPGGVVSTFTSISQSLRIAKSLSKNGFPEGSFIKGIEILGGTDRRSTYSYHQIHLFSIWIYPCWNMSCFNSS